MSAENRGGVHPSTIDFINEYERRRQDRIDRDTILRRMRTNQKRQTDLVPLRERIEASVYQPHEDWDAKITKTEITWGKNVVPVWVSTVYTPEGTTTEVDLKPWATRIRFDDKGARAFTYEIKDGEIVETEDREFDLSSIDLVRTLAKRLESK